MKSSCIQTLILVAALVSSVSANPLPENLPVPPQDQGLPYTRSARPMAREALGEAVALYPGSRYAHAHGYRTRLDRQRPLQGESVQHLGDLYVPEDFAEILMANADEVVADTAPEYLASRFVHTLRAPRVEIPPQVRRLQLGEAGVYFSAADLAELRGKPVARHESGLLIIGDASPAFFMDPVRVKAVITLFDTPDTLADPEIATEYIPLLKRQGKWTDWVKHTPEHLKMLEGPETEWKLVPREEYDYEGFDPTMLGSRVPPPGVYPRLLFSPEDLPMLRERIRKDAAMAYSFAEMEALLKTTWLNPEDDNGKMFARLASGEPIRLDEIPERDHRTRISLPFGMLIGYSGGIMSSHIPYISQCLVAIQFYALIQDDSELGRKAAVAAISWMNMIEDGMDEMNEISDSEWGTGFNTANGSETGYRGRLADHMNIALLLDMGGKWMTDEQKDTFRRIIAKQTYGMADSHAAGSIRWQENNHTTWHMTSMLSQMAIEGLEGSDPENFPRLVRTLQAFMEFGIDPDGVVFESNGKSGGGFRFLALNLVAAARRGENFFGHPHFRKLPAAQVQASSPGGTLTVTSGTYAGNLFDPQGVMFLKTFFPENREIDWLLGKHFPNMDRSDAGRQAYVDRLMAGNRHRIRLPIFNAPSSTRGTLYDTNFESVRREDLRLPLNFDAPVHGMFSAYSDHSEDAAWINLLVRANGYLGAGHHHADSGMFHFSALGVDWFRESLINTHYDGNLHNLVRIDRRSASDMGSAASGTYLGGVITPDLSTASADIKRSYDYRWIQQVQLWDVAGWWAQTPLSAQGVEFDDHPNVVEAFRGTQRYKMRNWWASYNYSNWIPTSRASYNPVEKAMRTVGLVRGARSYGVVMDDVRKDGESRLYQWSACPGRGVWISDYATAVAPLPPNQVVLGFEGPQAFHFAYKHKHHQDKQEPIEGKEGDPQLLVTVLNPLTPPEGIPLIEVLVDEGPIDQRTNLPMLYDNLLINHQGREGMFRVLMIPFRRGESLPEISFDPETEIARIVWPNQTDELHFSRSSGEDRFRLKLTRKK